MKGNNKMRKTFKMGITLAMIALLSVGCKGADNKGENPIPTVEVTNGTNTDSNIDDTVKEEPTLSEEAKKITQFTDLKKGDTVAEIVIKDYGTIKIKLFPKYAPKAVENFTTLAKEGKYDGVSFHRIMDNFMIQGGDPTGTGRGGSSIWGEPFEDEFTDKLQPFRGALCMANSGENTNGSQFFIVDADAASIQEMKTLIDERYKDELSLKDYFKEAYKVSFSDEEINNYLTYGGTPWLYKKHTVFGQVMDGFSVLDEVASIPVDSETNAPKTSVIMETVKIYEYTGK